MSGTVVIPEMKRRDQQRFKLEGKLKELVEYSNRKKNSLTVKKG
jgi:hypothetical protein